MTAPRRSVVAEADFDMQKRQKSRYVVSSLACGAVAGAVAKTTTAPLDRLKILIQVSSKPFELAHAPSRVREIIHHEGFKKLWRGNSATLARIMPYAGLQFTAYEQYKLLLQQVTDRKYDALHAAAALASARVLGNLARETTEARCRPARCRLRQHAQLTSLADAPLAARSNLKAGHTAIAGAGAGATATLCTYPLDYIRSRMAVQTHKSGEPFESLPHALRVSVAEHGWRSLFRGIWPTLIGIVPYAGTSFAVYETLKLSARGMRGTSRTDKELHPLERMGWVRCQPTPGVHAELDAGGPCPPPLPPRYCRQQL